MAGWINDYSMDYSPVVNALNSKYKDRAENRALMLKMLESMGNVVGRGISVANMENKAKENDEALLQAVQQGIITKEQAMPRFSGYFDIRRLGNAKQ